MRIAYASASILPSRTANSVQVMKMCAAFASNGHEVTLFTPDRRDEGLDDVSDLHDFYGVPRSFRIEFLPYLHPKGSPWRNLASALRCSASFLAALRRFRPELVYGRNLHACHAAAWAGYPVTFEVHGPVRISRLDALLFGRLVRSSRVRSFVAISSALRSLLAATEGLPPDRTLVAHDGADPVSPPAAPQPLPGRVGALQVGYVGSLYPGRGVGLLLELARRFPDMDFHFVGGEPQDLARWQGRTGKDAAPDHVHFHGHLTHAEAEQRRLACDVLLAPYKPGLSVAGGGGDTSAFMSPLKIFEYMASGKAILCSDLPVLREVLDQRTALLAPPEDLRAWTDGLEKLRDSGLRERLGAAAQHEFLSKYTWKRRAEAVLEIPSTPKGN